MTERYGQDNSFHLRILIKMPFEIPESIEKYFKSDKSNWYVEDSQGFKIWDESKVQEFWNKIRVFKTSNQDFDFTEYIFPEFEYFRNVKKNVPLEQNYNFWKIGEIPRFNVFIDFSNSIFLGHANFTKIVFGQSVDFQYATFHDEAAFNFSEFNHRVSFNATKFKRKAYFSSTAVHEDSSFYQTHFEGSAIFLEIQFQNSIFNNVDFGTNEILFDTVSINQYPSLIFSNVRLKDNVVFRNCNVGGFSFFNSDVSSTVFSNCIWSNKDRIVFNDEANIGDQRLFVVDNVVVTLEGLEETYRQLKRNFEINKNWELSGYAFISEMRIRQIRLWKEKNYFTWFIYWFYGFFGGYTQDFRKPLFSLIISIPFFAILYHITDCYSIIIDINSLFRLYNNPTIILDFLNEPFIKLNETPLFCGNAFRKSIESTFVIFKSTTKYKYWEISYMQKIFSSIVLTFIILALRKRFKQ